MRFLLETAITLALLLLVAATTLEHAADPASDADPAFGAGDESARPVATPAEIPAAVPTPVRSGSGPDESGVPEPPPAQLRFPVDPFVDARLIGRFGDGRDAGRRSHHGVDIEAPAGTPVLAALDGVVTVGSSPRGGNVLWLEAEDAGLRLFYAHLDRSTVSSGDRVASGTAIGTVGSSGNAATPHLHFEVRDASGTARDPLAYLGPLPQ